MPLGAQHVNGRVGAVLAETLVGGAVKDKEVEGEENAADVAQPLGTDGHARGEGGVQGTVDPGGAVEVAVVEAGEGLGRSEAEDGIDVFESVQGHQNADDDLPGRGEAEATAKPTDRAHTWAMTRTADEDGGPEQEDTECLVPLDAARRPPEQVVDHGARRRPGEGGQWW